MKTLVQGLIKHLGLPLTAVILATAVFVLPKVIYDDYKFYRNMATHGAKG